MEGNAGQSVAQECRCPRARTNKNEGRTVLLTLSPPVALNLRDACLIIGICRWCVSPVALQAGEKIEIKQKTQNRRGETHVERERRRGKRGGN